MKQFMYIFRAFLMILLVGSGCKSKKMVSEETVQVATDKADIENVEANHINANDETDSQTEGNDIDTRASDDENTAQALPSKKCEKWGTNPLFEDGHEFVYDVSESLKACCDLDDPGWKCDDDGDCTMENSYTIKCKVSLIQTESYFCASKLTCLNSDGEEVKVSNKFAHFDYSLDGYWIVDSNGLYHLNGESKLNLNKQAKPGDCKKTKYIYCKPETLAYEYTGFSKAEPIISFVKYKEMNKSRDGEHFIDSLTVTHEGTNWKRVDDVSGSDDFMQSVTFDEARGFTEFETSYAGGSEHETVLTLK